MVNLGALNWFDSFIKKLKKKHWTVSTMWFTHLIKQHVCNRLLAGQILGIMVGWLIDWLTHSLTHPLIVSPTHSYTDSLTCPLIVSLTHSFMHANTYSLTHLCIYSMTISKCSLVVPTRNINKQYGKHIF